jgi:hypothetical protein
MMNGWFGMAGFGLWHWVVFTAMVAVVLYPIGRILGRLGLSPFWSIFALVPFVNLIALWVLAFADWPRRVDEGA